MSWDAEGPPDEAYGRVTRDLATLYAPLLEGARSTIDELATTYDVERRAPSTEEAARVEGCVSDAVETTVLAPRTPDQSALIVGICDLPGVHLAFGRWASEHLPECGCDACDERLEDLLDQLSATCRLVIGGFDEWVRHEDGDWWLGHQTADGYGQGTVDRDDRARLGITGPAELVWRPWTRLPSPPDQATDPGPVR